MKKTIVSLLTIGLMVISPLTALAEVKVVPTIPNEPSSQKEVENGLVKTFPIYVEVTGEVETFKEAKFEFTFGSAIEQFDCNEYGDYKATQSGDVTSGGVCVFEVNSAVKEGEKLQVGTISVLVKKDAADKDCSINYMLKDASGTFNKNNPTTGATLPYEIIVGGLVLAAGAFIVTNKKTKLYKI